MTSHLRRTRVRLTALIAAAALLPWALTGAEAATRSELESTQQRIEQTLEELRAVDGRAAQTEEQVAAAGARVAQLEDDLNALLAQLAAQETRVADARARAEEAVAERDRIRQVVGDRARRAFMGGTPDPLMMLGGSGMGDVAGALDNLAVLDALAARADASIETLDVASVRADASAERLDAEVAALEQVQQAREQVLVEAQAVLAERADALQSLEQQQERLMAEQESLEAEEAEIQRIIAREAEAARRREQERQRQLEEQRRAAEEAADDAGGGASEVVEEAPPSATGCYQWPASGRATSEYGPRWGRFHAGIDIDGDTGDSLVAAQAGRVIYVGYRGGYGNLTLISHSDGVTTAYAHQSQFGVSEGQTVARGEFVGRMGATGNVTGSHLHFETRTSSGTRNPRNYLC